MVYSTLAARLEVVEILDIMGFLLAVQHIFPARGLLLWDGCNAQMGDQVQAEPDGGLASHPETLNCCRKTLLPIFPAYRKQLSLTSNAGGEPGR